MSANSAPGFRKHPEHRIETKLADLRVRVTFNGEVIADSLDAIRLDESKYASVYYVPRKDVKMERLARTTHSTHCPFKGVASYYTLSVGGRSAANAVWSYEQPYDEMSVIKERLAFYPDKVDSISVAQE
jgi:uncharacterized protein (DUF427 family)